MKKMKERVLKAINDGALTFEDVKNEVKKQIVLEALGELEREGKVVCDKDGLWSVKS